MKTRILKNWCSFLLGLILLITIVVLLFLKILSWEGGFVKDPANNGGATNMGVTLASE